MSNKIPTAAELRKIQLKTDEAKQIHAIMRVEDDNGKKVLDKATFLESNLARDNFLKRYTGGTLKLYMYDLDIWYTWCYLQGIGPLKVKRLHLESFMIYLKDDRKNSERTVCRRMQTLRSYYRLSAADELIAYDPTAMLKMPKWSIDPDSIPVLSPDQVGLLLRAAEKRSDSEFLLISLLVMLGLRVSEACSVLIENILVDGMGYYSIKVLRKGGSYSKAPVPVPLLRLIDKVKGSRESGHLILTKSGNPQNRRGAYDWFKRALRDAGLPDNAHPHTLRHSAITALIDAGEPIHKVQEFANHRDIRTTEHYYRRSSNLDQHSAHVSARIFSSKIKG